MCSPQFPNERDGAAAAELFELLLATDNLHDFLHHVAILAVEEVPAAGLSCGITTRSDGRAATVASSDAFARALDEMQYAAGMGPCLQAAHTGQVVAVHDLVSDDRWPAYRTYACATGLRCSLSLPLIVGRHGESVGALNLYAREPGVFTIIHRQRGLELAALAAGAIGVAIHIAEQARLTQQLHTALESRGAIDQAIGIIIAQRHCTPDAAFSVLRAASQRSNTKLRDIATRIVDATSGTPSPREPT